MSDISTEITRLQNAKTAIKTAIEAKGVTVGDGAIDTYAEKIGEISSGGSERSITVTVITHNPGHQYRDMVFVPNYNSGTNVADDGQGCFDVAPTILQDKDCDTEQWIQVHRDYSNGLTVMRQTLPISSAIQNRLITTQSWKGADWGFEPKTCILKIYRHTSESSTTSNVRNELGELMYEGAYKVDADYDTYGNYFGDAIIDELTGEYDYTLYFDFTSNTDSTSKIATKILVNFVLTSYDSSVDGGASKEGQLMFVDFENNSETAVPKIFITTSSTDTVILGGAIRKYHNDYAVIDVVLRYNDNALNWNTATEFQLELPNMSEGTPWSIANKMIVNGAALTTTVDTTNKLINVSFTPQADDFVSGSFLLKE